MTPSRLGRNFNLSVLAVVVSSVALAACSSPTSKVSGKKRSKEYFAESEYGVKASPRVSNLRSNLPRGGGRDQLGKPYKVKGKWYHPKEVPNYRNKGLASWYGDAFHGRLTANGEVYDMTHLTAAHPTMPLPSYARVTNTKNGHSVIVRVNDRGPYAHGRVIDLSRRAAEMLDYTQQGVAQVNVEYLGRAPLHGQDDQFLLASFAPGGNGGRAPAQPGLPDNVMIAMNGPTPTASAASNPFSQVVQNNPVPQPALGETVMLPDFAPIAPSRMEVGRSNQSRDPLAYADERVKRAAINAVENLGKTDETVQSLIEKLNARYSYTASSEYR